MEKRFATHEVRSAGRLLSGYASVFDSTTVFMGQPEVIRAGAFTETLKTRSDVLALADHDASKVLGRTRSGTLQLREDSHGLAFDLDLPNTAIGSDIRELSARGDLGGMSFGFDIVDDKIVDNIREIRAVKLYEISVVSAFAAYADTTANLRGQTRTPRLDLRRRTLRLWG